MSKRGRKATKKNEKFYAVDNILDKRVLGNGKAEYLISWAGYESEDNSWESEAKLMEDIPFVIEKFNEEWKNKGGSSNKENNDSSPVGGKGSGMKARGKSPGKNPRGKSPAKNPREKSPGKNSRGKSPAKNPRGRSKSRGRKNEDQNMEQVKQSSKSSRSQSRKPIGTGNRRGRSASRGRSAAGQKVGVGAASRQDDTEEIIAAKVARNGEKSYQLCQPGRDCDTTTWISELEAAKYYPHLLVKFLEAGEK